MRPRYLVGAQDRLAGLRRWERHGLTHFRRSRNIEKARDRACSLAKGGMRDDIFDALAVDEDLPAVAERLQVLRAGSQRPALARLARFTLLLQNGHACHLEQCVRSSRPRMISLSSVATSHRYSGFKLAALIAASNCGCSLFMRAPNSSGVVPPGSIPSAVNCAIFAGSRAAAMTCFASLSMTSGGVLAGTRKPFQLASDMPG